MINELNAALERNELSIVYQPQLDIRTGEITGNEALLRWQHAEFGSVPPAKFIPLAEASGLIISIGEWVLRTACAQNKAWQDAGMAPMEVSVNLSPLQFMQPDFVALVRTILEDTGLPPQYLDVEITEGMAMDINHVLTTLQQLKEIGVRISMDDFGKGYSSLYYLKRLPLDRLKIDKSFVSDCIADENDAILVKTIISMAQNLKLNVIAEGVETREQLQFLQQNLCDAAQGYLFSEPLSAEKLAERLPLIRCKVKDYGMDDGLTERMWLEEQLRAARQDLEDTVRKQQGLTFKFRQLGGRFIHTLCDGELLQRLGFTPAHIIGKDLHAFFPEEQANRIYEYYLRAWQGEARVTFENEVNDICAICTLRPIKRGGKVVEVIGNAIDISERKRMEVELRATKDNLESFINHNSDAIAIMGTDRLIRRVNAAYSELFGWTSEQLMGHPIPVVPDSLILESASMIEQVFNGQAVSNYETVRHRKDGSIVHVSLTLTPIKDESGKPMEVAAVIRDISNRKQAEAALKESEERYRQLVQMSPDIVIVHDHGKVLFMNQAGVDFEGTHEDISSRSLYSLLVPEQRAEAAVRVSRLMNGEKLPPIERKFINRRGEIVRFEVSSAPVQFEGNKVIQVIARDITERKRTEDALKLLIDQYEVIAEHLTDLVIVFDAAGDVTFVSPSHEAVLGYPAAFFNRETFMAIVHPDDRPILTSGLAGLRQSRSPRKMDFRYRHQDGGWVYVEARGTPIVTINGQIGQVILVSRDVTERHRVAYKLRESEGLAVIGTLASGIAYELRNPVTTIKGFVQLLKSAPFKLEYYDYISAEFKALESRIDELLLLSMPHKEESFMHVDVNQLLEEVVGLMDSQAVFLNTRIVFKPIDGRSFIRGHRLNLKKVFIHLLRNAIEAMPNGGRITVTVRKSDPAAIFVAVSDQGCGMSEERLKRIDEPFFSSKEKGAGFGLTISSKIVTEHGGSIVFRSKPNQGTTVLVRFPILDDRTLLPGDGLRSGHCTQS
ncbi:EAL domain-containing protein [Paenibacillus silvisoli]|uniref:EAL domain-containing protein n=1 Tax=Paenibacillus silvisoli TaxID=3110539 RepID=UPI00280383AD|nr:EAL domain-containing protein [Paenibacillus silvisoli]